MGGKPGFANPLTCRGHEWMNGHARRERGVSQGYLVRILVLRDYLGNLGDRGLGVFLGVFSGFQGGSFLFFASGLAQLYIMLL